MSGVDETTCGDRLETDQVAEGDWVCLSVGQEEVPEEEAPQEQPDKEGRTEGGGREPRLTRGTLKTQQWTGQPWSKYTTEASPSFATD